jgi:peptidyl-prolyl cis-trans isomerase C
MKITRRRGYIIGLVALVALAGASGCGKPAEKEVVLASVGNFEIKASDFDARIANLPARYREVVKRRKSEYLNELINDTLLYREALERGLDDDEEVRRVIAEAEKKILIARLLKDEIDDALEIPDDEVNAFYEENEERYRTPELMRASHILVMSEEDAREILEDYAAGVNFESLAKAKSMDPTAQRGGDIGYFPKGQLMPEFENACAGLDVGEVSGIVRTNLGYHLIKLTDRREPVSRPVKDVEGDIRARLRVQKRQRMFNELLEKLREDTEIKINSDALSAEDGERKQQ